MAFEGNVMLANYQIVFLRHGDSFTRFNQNSFGSSVEPSTFSEKRWCVCVWLAECRWMHIAGRGEWGGGGESMKFQTREEGARGGWVRIQLSLVLLLLLLLLLRV